MKRFDSSKLHPFRLEAWHRRLFIALVAVLTSQLYLSLWSDGFRVSASAIFYSVLLVTLMRDSHRPDTGLVTCAAIILFRAGVDVAGGMSPLRALLLEYPGGLFYLLYDVLLCLLVSDRRTLTLPGIWLTFTVSDFTSNLLDLSLSGGMPALPAWDSVFSLAAIALFRSCCATLTLWLIQHYRKLLLSQEHERRYQRLFLMTAGLKNELYFLRKSAEEAEQVMANAYRLYERLGELEHVPQELHTLALSIARDVHELKKDNLRIVRGLEGEVDDAYDRESIRFSDLLRILEDSTRRLLGEQRAELRLECVCTQDFSTREHYQLIAILKNLVTNAAEALQTAGSRGTIRVLQHIRDGRLLLTVEDNGPGISPRGMQNLFKVGYSTKFDPQTGSIGRGVGLVSVQHIVDELGGTIRVDSVPGRGTRFDLSFPLEAIQEEEPPA